MKNIVDLNHFAGGAVAERFNQELQKLIENITDPNTDAKKARTLTLTVKVISNEKRDIAGVQITTKSTLQPAKAIESALVLDCDSKGQVTGAELQSGAKGQTFITDGGEVADDKGKVISFK